MTYFQIHLSSNGGILCDPDMSPTNLDVYGDTLELYGLSKILVLFGLLPPCLRIKVSGF